MARALLSSALALAGLLVWTGPALSQDARDPAFPVTVEAVQISPGPVGHDQVILRQVIRPQGAVRLTEALVVRPPTRGRAPPLQLSLPAGSVAVLARLGGREVHCMAARHEPGRNRLLGVAVCFQDTDGDRVFDQHAVASPTGFVRSGFEAPVADMARAGWTPVRAAYAPVPAAEAPAAELRLTYFFVASTGVFGVGGQFRQVSLNLCWPPEIALLHSPEARHCSILTPPRGVRVRGGARMRALNAKPGEPETLSMGLLEATVVRAPDGKLTVRRASALAEGPAALVPRGFIVSTNPAVGSGAVFEFQPAPGS